MSATPYRLKRIATALVITILFQTITVTTMAARDFREDALYEGKVTSDVEDIVSPQAAREAFGPPASWMKWVEDGENDGSGGAYAGFTRQDGEQPFLFHGGGFNGEYAFTGKYALVCTKGQLGSDLQAGNIYDLWSSAPGTFRFGNIPAIVDVRRGENVEAACRAFPIDLYSNVRFAPGFHDAFKEEMEKWRARCEGIGGNPLPFNLTAFPRRCFRIVPQDVGQPKETYTLQTTVIGVQDRWYAPSEYTTRTMVFEVPEEIKPSFEGLNAEKVDYISDFVEDGSRVTLLILKNGQYLRAVSISESRSGG